MKLLLLSYYDSIAGPRIFLQEPIRFRDEDLKQIPVLMDLYEEGFFIHEFGGYKTANLKFKLRSDFARGKEEMLMISYLLQEGEINSEIVKDLLYAFVEELEREPDIFRAFYRDKACVDEFSPQMACLRDLFSALFRSLPKETDVIRRTAKIFVFGPAKSGKTTILNCLKHEFSKTTLPTTNVDISKLLVGNLQFLTYDAPGQVKFQQLWKPFLKNQDGLVFVVDCADEGRYEEAHDMLHRVIEMPELKALPLLILCNKKDLKTPDLEHLTHAIGISDLGTRHFRYFLTSGLVNEGIVEAFDWFAERLSSSIMPAPRNEVNLLVAKWDEDEGPIVLAHHPLDGIDDADTIAVQSFSLSQFVFGGEEFKKTAFTMPFVHLNSKASIFFDYLPDSTVRGGRLPLMLAAFFNERIPMSIIEQFNPPLWEHFSKIKTSTEPASITQILQELHGSIVERIKALTPTLRALQVAERRYQALFRAARDAILIIDRKLGIIVDANDEAATLLTLPREACIGLPLGEFQESSASKLLEEVQHHLQTDQSPLFTTTLLSFTKKSIPVEISVSEIQMGGQHLIQCIFRDIRARLKAEKALRESEVRHRMLLETMNEAFGVINKEGNWTYVNPKFGEMLQYTKEEMLGRNIKTFFDAANLKIMEEQLARRKQGETGSYEIAWQRKDGTNIPTIVSPRPMTDDGGGHQGSFAVVTDISAIVEIKKRLKASEAHHRMLLETMNDGFGVINKEGNWTFVNPKFAKMLQYTKEEMLGRNIKAFFDATNLKILEDQLERRKHGETAPYEIEWQRKDGLNVLALVSPRQMVDCDGNHQGSFAVVTDISGIVEMEKRLKASEAHHRMLLETMNEAFGIINKEGNWTYVNPKFGQLLQYTKEEMLGRNINAFFDATNLKKLEDQLERRRQGETAPYEIEWQRKDGSNVLALVSPRQMVDCEGNHQGSFAVVTDISQLREMETAWGQSEARFRKIVDNNPFPIMAFSDGDVEYINPQFTDVFGYTKEEIPTGAEWSRKAYPDPGYRHYVIKMWKAYENKPYDPELGPDPYTFLVQCKNGDKKITIFRPVTVEPGRTFFICEDITHRKDQIDLKRLCIQESQFL